MRVMPGPAVRPTSDRVREAIFSALGPLGRVRVLDLFAGSGALGLEALSRGAASCTFVESDFRVAGVLRENIVSLDFATATTVLHTDYRSALRTLLFKEERFDLLFVDPPYKMLAQVEEAAATALPRLLGSGGLVVVEGPAAAESTLALPVVFRRRYGTTLVTIYVEESDRGEHSAVPGDV